MRRKPRRDPPWTPFERASFTPENTAVLQRMGEAPDAVWMNNLYQACVRALEPIDGWPPVLHLSIKRRDREPIDRDHWRVLQRIKNALVGPEHEAVELFPAESRLVDTSNQYHLWVLGDREARFPFGWYTRLVGERSTHGAKQRAWDDDARPADLQDEQIAAAMATVKAGAR